MAGWLQTHTQHNTHKAMSINVLRAISGTISQWTLNKAPNNTSHLPASCHSLLTCTYPSICTYPQHHLINYRTAFPQPGHDSLVNCLPCIMQLTRRDYDVEKPPSVMTCLRGSDTHQLIQYSYKRHRNGYTPHLNIRSWPQTLLMSSQRRNVHS